MNILFGNVHREEIAGWRWEPSMTLPKLIFAINDELSRDRLAKAMDFLSSACRSKSKFD